jgi:Dyp-type peroxidase family
MARRETPDLDDIQGNVLQGYGSPHAAYVFARVPDKVHGRRFLGEVMDFVTPATCWTAKPSHTLNVSFTCSGLAALGTRPLTLAGFPAAFRDGMAARADLLGDTGAGSPSQWDHGIADEQVLVTLTAWDRRVLDHHLEDVLDHAGHHGVTTSPPLRADKLTRQREHFGFLDGFSQPALAGNHEPPSIGTPGRFSGWRPIPLGEFLLGYRDADGVLPAGPPGPLGRNGTFVVLRKLYQDVAAFRRFVDDIARKRGDTTEHVAAQLLGRWRDGTPLALSPDRPDPAITGDPSRINTFRFGDDPGGLRCPLGAHIRRANPRDGEALGGVMTERHRMIRRGVPYGAHLPKGATDDGQDRGLVFVAFMSDLEGQFEFVQSQWLNSGDVLGLGDDPDPVVGARDPAAPGKVVLPGDPPVLAALGDPFVVCRGGAYLFQPSLSGLRALVDGSA